MKVLVTGAAGFIGSHTCHRLLDRGDEVTGLDNLNPYYDPSLKQARLDRLTAKPKFRFAKLDLADRAGMDALFTSGRFDRVVHLAAQAGVRYAVENPHSYVDSNLVGTLHVLEGCRHNKVQHLVYASTSSVYGSNSKMPFSEHDGVDHPLSLYAATKKANELMAHSYSHLFAVPTTGLRFFTVYGPWGRPDMALFKFTKAMLADEPIEVFNFGKHRRDFTYVDDIVEGVVRALDRPAAPDASYRTDAPDAATSNAPWRIYNIGCSRPVDLTVYIETLEQCLGKTARKKMLPLQPGDVPDTYADVTALGKDIGYAPKVTVQEGVKRFVEWYRDYYRV
ncbi:MAG: NAD-dependent epimerase [Phycisphaerae bacterium]|nr:NAD-dependent epimerase [Phycisphaerae bacterium]